MIINYIEFKSPITPINQDHVDAFLRGIEEEGNFTFEKCEA